MSRRPPQTLELDEAQRAQLLPLLHEIVAAEGLSPKRLNRLQRRFPRPEGGLYSRSDLIHAWRELAGTGGLPRCEEREDVLLRLRRKPQRSASGVTPVSILTRPHPCPGECIFCPADVRMPKSYLADEPGAQRAEQNAFDPYLQTWTRLQTYWHTGHPTDKIELIILGGTWSFYPEHYQVWFIKRSFDALHDFGRGIDRRAEVLAALAAESALHPEAPRVNAQVDGRLMQRNYNQVVGEVWRGELQRSPVREYATWDELEAAHQENEAAACRCVGLVIETRPDHISEEEVLRVRRLGCTKVQIGIQSLNDAVLAANRRGHDVAATRRALRLLRRAGFKIHAHWMPNLYGSTPGEDVADFGRLFDDVDFRPDELKIYPCSLIESAELMQRHEDGSWRPYTHDELLDVLTACLRRTPEYCRLTRVIRDIPSTDIVVGNQLTNFRQIAEEELAQGGERSRDIRAREIRQRQVRAEELQLDEQRYRTSCSEEVFLQVITPERDIAAFLRLSLPTDAPLTAELRDAAMVREVHVYGQSLRLGEAAAGNAQHAGLGTRLLERAAVLARQAGYARLAVISATGTRDYYRRRGYVDGELYQWRDLAQEAAAT